MFYKQAVSAGRYLMLAFLAVSMSGCVIHFSKSKSIDDQEEPNSIMVVGYLDDSEAPFTMKWGEIKQVRPVIDEPYQELRSNNEGLFYLENLPVGSYQLEELGGPDKGFLSQDTWAWGFGDVRGDKGFERTELRASKPGIYFLGSYKIDMVKKGGLFSMDKYETLAVAQPTEKQVLQKLLPITKGTRWESVVRKRIRQLN